MTGETAVLAAVVDTFLPSLPAPPGVNPMITIMARAERTAAALIQEASR